MWASGQHSPDSLPQTAAGQWLWSHPSAGTAKLRQTGYPGVGQGQVFLVSPPMQTRLTSLMTRSPTYRKGWPEAFGNESLLPTPSSNTSLQCIREPLDFPVLTPQVGTTMLPPRAFNPSIPSRGCLLGKSFFSFSLSFLMVSLMVELQQVYVHF